MSTKLYQFVFGLLFCSFSLFAQNTKIVTSNKEAVKIYDQILSTRNPYAVLDILKEVDIEKMKVDSLKAYFFYYKGSAYGQLAKFDSALFYMKKADIALPANQYPIIKIQILRAYGNINWARNFYHIALEFYEEALNISNELNHAEFQISLLGNIAGIYAKLENMSLALKYALDADIISQKSGVARPRSR